jgi:N-acetylglucosaminyl-diphospho-decaprenol L-rhamnosyltransferase
MNTGGAESNVSRSPASSECSGVRLGICVLNWNAGAILTRCVKQLVSFSDVCGADIVVVDNASSDGSPDAAAAIAPSIHMIRSLSNLGFARGHNVGARYLLDRGCDYLLFINPDVLITPLALRALVETLVRTPEAGCCGGLPLNEKGVSRMACRNRPSPGEKLFLYGPFARLSITRHLASRHFVDYQKLQNGSPVYAVSGACILFRAIAFKEINGFDEATFLYEEEFIISERLESRGWKTVISTACSYLHSEAHSTSQIPNRRRLHFIRSEQYLLKRYYRWSAGVLLSFRVFRLIEYLLLVAPNILAGQRKARSQMAGAASSVGQRNKLAL